MTEFTMEAAGISVAVSALFASTRDYCARFLTEEPAEFSVSVCQEDLDREREKAAKEDALEGLPIRNMTDAQLEITAVQRKITEKLFDRGILLFHGSVIAVDGQGYLFTAKSGTGKSTHTRLWRQLLGDRAVMINDDKPFLELGEGRILAHGSAWMGKHGLGCRGSVPLKAICILERGVTNEIQKIAPKEALFMLLQQSNRPQNKEKWPQYLEMIDKIAGTVAFYRLRCNMEAEAAEVAFAAMREETQ